MHKEVEMQDVIQILDNLFFILMGGAITLTVILVTLGINEIEKWYNEYQNPANILKRAKERMVSKHWEALEEFKNDIQKVTRR